MKFGIYKWSNTNHFLTRDPYPGAARVPASQNGYSYVHGNPVNYTDPSGFCIDTLTGNVKPGEYPSGTSGLCPLPTIPIWTRPFIDDPYWVQFYGPTVYSENAYSTKFHTGLDWGREPQALGGTWNRETQLWNFDDTYPSEARPRIPVYAGCNGTVDADPNLTGPVGKNKKGEDNPYAPERVTLISDEEAYEDLQLIYGHLMDVQVSPGESITPDTIIGYLETSEYHVHVEIRSSDNRYINPFPYLSSDLQIFMLTFAGNGPRTTYRSGLPDNVRLQRAGRY